MELPLTKADITQLRKAIATLRELDRHLELAQQADIDVSEQVARHAHLKQAATKILETYEPLLRRDG